MRGSQGLETLPKRICGRRDAPTTRSWTRQVRGLEKLRVPRLVQSDGRTKSKWIRADERYFDLTRQPAEQWHRRAEELLQSTEEQPSVQPALRVGWRCQFVKPSSTGRSCGRLRQSDCCRSARALVVSSGAESGSTDCGESDRVKE